jgi:hypothetical protein
VETWQGQLQIAGFAGLTSAAVKPLGGTPRAQVLMATAGPFAELRTSGCTRTTTLYQGLAAMITDGIVVKSADNYSLSVH